MRNLRPSSSIVLTGRFCMEEAAVSWGWQGFLAGGELDASVVGGAIESDAFG